jgi:hypothetical protein
MGRLEVALLVLVGLGLGLSPLTYGFYDLAIWGPIALMLLAVLFGLVIARPATLRRSAVAAIVGLVALWGWALLSTAWAESGERALTEANRWMLYAALLGVLLSLLRTDRLGKVLLATTTAAVLGVGVYMLVAMALGDGGELFLGGRLEGLLGYINGQAAYLLLGFWPLVALAEYARRPPVRGLAAAGATLLAALVLLSQSRAVVPALLVSAVVLLVAIPGRQRRAWALGHFSRCTRPRTEVLPRPRRSAARRWPRCSSRRRSAWSGPCSPRWARGSSPARPKGAEQRSGRDGR